MSSRSSVVARAAPFAVFVALLALRGALGDAPGFDARWLYALQAGLPAALLLYWRKDYAELAAGWTARGAGAAALLGLAMSWIWIHATAPWMSAGAATASFVPVDAAGAPRPDLVALRLAGAVAVVPLLEELFWRSLLMRWIDRRDFLALAPGRASLRALAVSSAVFAAEHTLWLAGLGAGLLYGAVYRVSGNLRYAVVAHASTNLALGLWVVERRAWSFW